MTKHRGYYDDDDNEHGYGEDGGDGEHRGRGDGNDDAFAHRFGTVDANAIDPAHPGQMYFGNGNLATGYNIADNAKEHVEVALKVHPRGGVGDQTPTFDRHGDPIYRKRLASRPRHGRTGTLISAQTRRSAVATIL
jgi:hypothetical protein